MDPSQIRKIADLAKLNLAEDEMARFGEDVGKILDFVSQLESLDLAPQDAVADQPLIARADVPGPSLAREKVQAMAPDWQDHLFRFPEVLKKEEP